MSHTVWWAGVSSRSHLTYGISWLRTLLRREPGPVTLRMFPSRTFFGDDAITPESIARQMDDARVTVDEWDGQPADDQSRLWMISTGAVGIKPWLRLRAKHPLRRILVVVTDEGLGTYGNYTSRVEAMQRQGVKEPWRSVRATVVGSATKALTNLRWPLHIQTGRTSWALNEPAATEFRRDAPAPDRSADRLVFLSQPWPELGVLDESTYLAHVDEVARYVEAAGLDFVVLPHPGEPADRHSQWQVAGSPALAERNPLALGAKAVVGASSTALLNLAAVHDIPAFRVGTPELLALDGALAPRQASLLANYAAPAVAPSVFGRRLAQSFGRLP